MKKILVSAILAVTTYAVFAQIKVNESQIIQVGQNVIRETDTIPNITGYQNTGTNLYWDFTGHVTHSTVTTTAISPAATPYGSDFPSSNIALTNDNVNFLYFQSSTSELNATGLAGDFFGNGTSLVAQLNPPSITYDYPLEYPKTYSGNYTIVESADGSQFGVDSVRLNRTASHTNTVEAYGMVETNYGIFKTIKDKRVEYTKDDVYAYFSILPGIIPPSWSLVTTIYDTTVNYYWHTREGKLPVAEVSTNLQNDIDSTTLIISQATPEPLANFGFEDACAGTVVQFTDSSIQNPTSWHWSFGDGSTSIDQNPTHTYVSGGTFTVRLIVNRNYADTLEKTITIYQATADAGNDQDICPGESVTLTASGGVSYEWSTNETTASISVSPANSTNYTVTVTDANGCTDTDQVLVTVNPEPTAALFDAVSCNGNNVTLDAQNPGSSYQWSNNAISQTITVNTPDTYIVTITNTFSCSITDTAVVTAGANLTVPLVDVDACDGETVTLNAGNTGATYDWSNSASTQTISVSSGGTFTVTVTDQGCSGVGSATVTFNPNPNPEILGDSVLCFGQSTYLYVNTNDQITWSDLSGNDSLMVSPSSSQYYYVDLENTFSCSARDSVYVKVNPLPNALISGDTEICQGEQTTLTASGGVDYVWNTSDNTASIQVGPLNNTSYTVTVTDNNNCQSTVQENVIVNASPSVNITGATEICEGEQTTLTASGGVSYSWSSGDNTAGTTVSPTTGTGYVVTVTGNNGCTGTEQTTVDVNALPNVQFAFGDTSVCSTEIGTPLTLLATPAGGNYSGLGVSGSSMDLNVLVDSNFTSTEVLYTYTDGNNCSATASIEVSVETCNGISSILNIDFELYPNPANNGFYVQSNVFNNEEVVLNLIDLNGKIHSTILANNTKTYITTDQLAEGLYFLIGRDESGKLLLESKVQIIR